MNFGWWRYSFKLDRLPIATKTGVQALSRSQHSADIPSGCLAVPCAGLYLRISSFIPRLFGSLQPYAGYLHPPGSPSNACNSIRCPPGFEVIFMEITLVCQSPWSSSIFMQLAAPCESPFDPACYNSLCFPGSPSKPAVHDIGAGIFQVIIPQMHWWFDQFVAGHPVVVARIPPRRLLHKDKNQLS